VALYPPLPVLARENRAFLIKAAGWAALTATLHLSVRHAQWARAPEHHCCCSCMAKALMVTTKGSQRTWAVYLMVYSPRGEGEVVPAMGPLAGSVASWAELDDLADQCEVESHQIYGGGLDQMEHELGPKP
jgi:hypothetical protein